MGSIPTPTLSGSASGSNGGDQASLLGLTQKEFDDINKSHAIWMQKAPVLYDICTSFTLTWPSASVQWLPKSDDGDNKHQLLVGTYTGDPHNLTNYLKVVSYRIPRTNPTLKELGKCTKLDVVIKSALPIPGNIFRARAMPSNPNIVAAQCSEAGGSFIFVRDIGKKDGKGLVLNGQAKEGYGLSWQPGFNPTLLSCSYDKLIYLWDINANYTNTAETRFNGHTAEVADVGWDPFDENVFGSVGDDRQLLIWDKRVAQHTLDVEEAHEDDINAISFNALKQWTLATGSSDKTVAIWDTRRLDTKIHSLQAPGCGEVLQVKWHPNSSKVLASGGKDLAGHIGRVRVWDLEKYGSTQSEEEASEGPPELIFIHGGHMNDISDFDWNTQEKWLISSVGEDNFLQIWRMADYNHDFVEVEIEEVD